MRREGEKGGSYAFNDSILHPSWRASPERSAQSSINYMVQVDPNFSSSSPAPSTPPTPKPVFEEPDKIGGFVCFFWILLAFLLISQLN